jgi:hypothetical protein
MEGWDNKLLVIGGAPNFKSSIYGRKLENKFKLPKKIKIKNKKKRKMKQETWNKNQSKKQEANLERRKKLNERK